MPQQPHRPKSKSRWPKKRVRRSGRQREINNGGVLALIGRTSDATEMLISGMANRTTGSTIYLPVYLPYLARAHAEHGQFEEAWRCIGEAMTTVETAKEKWCEAEVHRVAGEIALMSPVPDAAKAEAYFEHALAVARKQQAKSWELRATMSMARLWRDQGKRQAAHDFLALIYGWFTEGFDTLDLSRRRRCWISCIPDNRFPFCRSA